MQKNKFFLYILCCIPLYVLSEYRSPETSLLSKTNGQSAITWIPSGGRFGDNLLSYSKALWLSHKYNIPVLYLPFLYSDQLVLHEQETMYTPEIEQSFATITHLPSSSHYHLHNNINTLYVSHWKTEIVIDWFNQEFVEELKKKIAPRYPLEKIIIPTDCVSIAIHVRNGGSFAADTEQEKERCPLRFAPDEFFIAQIQRLAKMFNKENLYVHIFTDHPEPAVLAQKFNNALNDPRITIGYREQNNSHKTNVLEDFFSMMGFDCLIRPGSHFSRFVQRLGKNKIVIYPESIRKKADGTTIINVINMKTRAHEHERWKTKKITIA